MPSFVACKSGDKPGFPRFRSVSRYDSFEVDAGSFGVQSQQVSVVRLGSFRLKTRCQIRGTPKTLRIKRCGHKWQAVIVCDIGPAPEKIAVSRAVGIDIGLTSLVTLSSGREMANLRWVKQEQDRLAGAHRNLSRKQQGSKNRPKAKEGLRRRYQRLRGKRRSYLHEISSFLVAAYDLIAFEKLDIQSLAQGQLSKSILDAAWRELLFQVTYRVEHTCARRERC
jgi:putative transposase